jgi:hypothetical protein
MIYERFRLQTPTTPDAIRRRKRGKRRDFWVIIRHLLDYFSTEVVKYADTVPD